ncbi:MAG TPA: glycine cleavage system aminomethyltransferase GcvT, partial [Gammaproteobacteria bacterium]|nr:glycine cleavage system aminomethyltransferase GcvT [Gammaproteobacteria bacterium]
RALYTCMLLENGGIIDDLIAYRLGDSDYRLVVNAATRAKDLSWLAGQAGAFSVDVAERADLAMIAVQGPAAVAEVARLATSGTEPATLRPFTAMRVGDWFVARTGYTGEDGLEILLAEREARELWQALAAQGVTPCGLGARDTLRLEAGMNLYGQDMDESVTPLECGLAWTVDLGPDRDFIGRAALERERATGSMRVQIGLLLVGRGVLRAGYEVATSAGRGRVTSGSFAPTLGRSIALARVPASAREPCEVVIRDRAQAAKIVKPPFVRNGKVKIPLD